MTFWLTTAVKKPHPMKSGEFGYVCSRCGKDMGKYLPKFCPLCARKVIKVEGD